MNIQLGSFAQHVFSGLGDNMSPGNMALDLLKQFGGDQSFDAAGMADALTRLQYADPDMARAVSAEINGSISPMSQGELGREMAFLNGEQAAKPKPANMRAGDRNSAENTNYPADIAAAVKKGATRVGPVPGWQEPAVKGDIGPNGNPYSDGRYSVDGKEKYRVKPDGTGKAHQGIDIPAKYGDPVYAAAAGTVIEVRVGSGYGKLVVIDHKDGTSTMYAHLSKQEVKVGQDVKIGQVIGNVGTSGNGINKGEHLHFEAMKTPPDNKILASSMPNLNPTAWIKAGGW
jgi:murein DD-endopeptidase MepM/ murein hydrolase activator NlpD